MTAVLRHGYCDLHGHDDCNSSSTTATFTIEDTTAPAIDMAAMAMVECDGAGNSADLDAWLASNGGANALTLAATLCGPTTSPR